MVYQVFYTLLFPPSIFIIMLAFFCCWLYKRDKRSSKILSVIILCFYIFTIPLFSNYLITSLESAYNPTVNIDNCDVIIMLGGGATLDTPNIDGMGHLSGASANRLLTTAVLYKKANLPIIISGGQVFSDSGEEAKISKHQLILLGVPEEKIILEDKSRNTIENAKYVRAVLNEHNFKKPILITSAFHMKRSVQYFFKQKIEAQPFPTDYTYSLDTSIRLSSFIPSSSSIYIVGLALKEYLGIAAGLLLS
ncbi:MAG: hypothetical protein VR69_14845 [Peptococcaceae bacterium BRH_c4b]|nr:MAG: hypothetical protein VR69_14845 [Peptococcaceae bacterium BRH_c4b]